MSDQDDEIRRLAFQDMLFDEFNPVIADKIKEAFEKKDYFAPMLQELWVMQRNAGDDYDKLMAPYGPRGMPPTKPVPPDILRQGEIFDLRFSALALAIRLLAKQLTKGGGKSDINLYKPPRP